MSYPRDEVRSFWKALAVIYALLLLTIIAALLVEARIQVALLAREVEVFNEKMNQEMQKYR